MKEKKEEKLKGEIPEAKDVGKEEENYRAAQTETAEGEGETVGPAPAESDNPADNTGSDSEKEEEAISSESADDILATVFSAYPQALAAARDAGTFEPKEECATFLASVEGYARGGGLVAEEIDAALAQLIRMGQAYGCGGAFTLDMLETLVKGLSHDRLLAEAEQAAEIRGRNANIQAQMRRSDSSDGLPHLNGTAPRRAARSRGIFSIAETAR